jgi:hypothetical protein
MTLALGSSHRFPAGTIRFSPASRMYISARVEVRLSFEAPAPAEPYRGVT